MKRARSDKGATGQPQPSAPDGSPASKTRGTLVALQRALLKVALPFRNQRPANSVTPDEAVASFLGTMASTAERTYGQWRQHLEIGLAGCLGADARKVFFESYPVEDYYFAGVVALETAKLRRVYSAEEADALLSEIGDQIDHASNRTDRVMSDMVFDVIGRIEVASGATMQKMPYDTVTKAILRHLNLHRNDATQELMADKAFRHALGEPLAVGVQNWWQAFQSQFVLYIPPSEEPDPEQEIYVPVAPERTRRRRPLKRAPSLI